MKNISLLVALALVALGGCTSARLVPLADDDTLYFSKLPARPYRELAYVETTGSIFSNRAQLLRQLRAQQQKAQADALVQVRYDFVFWWPHASAVAVKFE